MKTHLRSIIWLAALIEAALLTSCSTEQKEKKVATENPITVRVGSPAQLVDNTISISGQIESKQTAIISTRVMGFVSSVKVKPGEHVQKGQLLANISSEDLLAKRAQTEAMIIEAEAALLDASKDYERFEDLYKKQSASAKEFENATLRFQSVKAKVEAVREMKNEINAMLRYTDLVAPFDGVVTQKNIDEGSMANPGMPLLIIEQPGSYRVSASVAESEVKYIRVGMLANVRVKSTAKNFSGKISEISPSSHFTGGQFQLKVEIPSNESDDLFSGMYVNLAIVLKAPSETPGLFVPASAIVQRDQLTGVYTVGDDQTAQLRWLKLGKKQNEQVEILSGLRADELFISQSDGKLYSGAPVIVSNALTLSK